MLPNYGNQDKVEYIRVAVGGGTPLAIPQQASSTKHDVSKPIPYKWNKFQEEITKNPIN